MGDQLVERKGRANGGEIHVVLSLALKMLSRILRFCSGQGGGSGLSSSEGWEGGPAGRQLFDC